MDFRSRVLNCLGKFPDNVDLQPEVISSVDKESYTLKLVSYNVEPGERIKAYLLVPRKLKDKNPAIVASHQHKGEFWVGKSEPAGLSRDTSTHYGLELCKRGYIVICPDHLGFEDRRPEEFVRKENQHLEGANYERFLFCKYIMKGSSLQAKYVSDLTRAVDFLQSLEHVDNERIGAIGHSLGGQETLWLTWFDKRIKAAVSSCGFSQIRTIIRDGINHNLAMFSFGFLNIGDVGDLVCDLAPTPFMMTNGNEDRIFPIDGVYEIAEAARTAYSEKNAGDNFKSVVFQGGHSFSNELREEAYQWLDRFLMNV